jgi:uncharacterized protein
MKRHMQTQPITKFLRWICLLLFLVACGQVDSPQAVPTITAGVQTEIITATLAPSATVLPAPNAIATPVPTFAQVLVDIAGPSETPTLVNAPLIVTPTLQTIELQINGHTLIVELASTPEQRQIGLMNRPAMAENTGMLFIFPNDELLSFWMRNTLIPLSIAFIDANRVILNIEAMQPLDETTFHTSNGPARYALEVNQGWFAARGIEAGDSVTFTLPTDLDVR